MRVVIVNDYAAVQGGAAQVAVKSAAALAEKGFDVTFIYGGGGVDDSLIRANLKVISLEQFDLLSNPSRAMSAVNGIWNKDVERRMALILAGFDPENTIVHVHSWVKSLSVSVFKILAERRFSLVVSLHDYFTACPNGGFYNYRKNEVCSLVPMSLDCVLTNCDSRSYLQKTWRVIRQAVYSRIDFPDFVPNFISVSSFSEKILKPYLPHNARFWRVRNPVDVVKRPPAKPGESANFTFIGRLSPEKGCLVLSRLQSIPTSRLQIVGSGELEPILRERLPLANFLGWCNGEQIFKILEDTRALIFTSELYETQGLVVSEAAARGVPSVVSDVTAATEFIEDGITGMLYRSGSAQSLDRILSRLAEDDQLVSQMGRESYDRFWEDPPDLESHVNGLVSCYESILSEKMDSGSKS